MHTNLFFAAAFASAALAQYTSSAPAVSVPTPRTGTFTVSSYSAHPPGFTPSHVDTATMPSFSGTTSYKNSSSTPSVVTSVGTSHVVPTQSGTTTPVVTSAVKASGTGNFTGVAATSTRPTIPIASLNTGAFRQVAGSGLALVVAGSLFSVLL